jgi:hypothetical protein
MPADQKLILLLDKYSPSMTAEKCDALADRIPRVSPALRREATQPVLHSMDIERERGITIKI